MTANREALSATLKDNPRVEPPYTFSQLDEAAVNKEIVYIFNHARPETKIMYGLGHDRDGYHEENWIIRWLLWHVFRYRDDRNSGPSRKRGQSASLEAVMDDEEASDDTPEPIDEASGIAAATIASQQGGITERTASSGHTSAGEQITPSRFWDPVRDDFRSAGNH